MTHIDDKTKIKGLYSTTRQTHAGGGSTVREVNTKSYWYAEEGDTGIVFVQQLNRNFVPTGTKRGIERSDFLAQYAPEQEVYETKVRPNMRQMGQTIARAERYRDTKKPYSAEVEFNKALAIDEESVRANFGLGLSYLDRGERGKATDVFTRIVRMDAAFQEEHKHLFNDFGINLRKNKMFDHAISYYEKAISISPEDEHLHCNIARAYYGKGDLESAKYHLREAVTINGNVRFAEKFLNHLEKKKGKVVKQHDPAM